MSYVAAKGDNWRLTTDMIAEAVKDHPARVRQIVAALVKAGLLKSLRGAGGGIAIARPPEQITLRDLYLAVEDGPPLALGLRDPFRNWDNVCFVRPVLGGVLDDMEQALQDRLAAVKLTELYTPTE
jgi:Rrf2 family protein